MKKRIPVLLLCVLIVGLLLSVMPWNRNISVQTTAYEYALDQEEPLRTHEVTIEGKYFYGIWRDAYFDGTFAVSGFPFSLEEPARITFGRENGLPGMMIYRDWAGQPRSKELSQIYGESDFSEFVLIVMELEQEGDRIIGKWSPETGHILCTNAPDYSALQEQCRRLGLHIPE